MPVRVHAVRDALLGQVIRLQMSEKQPVCFKYLHGILAAKTVATARHMGHLFTAPLC